MNYPYANSIAWPHRISGSIRVIPPRLGKQDADFIYYRKRFGDV